MIGLILLLGLVSRVIWEYREDVARDKKTLIGKLLGLVILFYMFWGFIAFGLGIFFLVGWEYWDDENREIILAVALGFGLVIAVFLKYG